MKLPLSLQSITRSQLLSCVNQKPDYNIPNMSTRTEAQRARKIAFEKDEQEFLAGAAKVIKTLGHMLDSPATDAVAVMMFAELGHPRLGQKQFLQIGPTCTFQFDKLSGQFRIGDMPSSTYWAQHYCPTVYVMKRFLSEPDAGPRSFPYGPFAISARPTFDDKTPFLYSAVRYPNTKAVLPPGNFPIKLPPPQTDLKQLLSVLDTAVCSEEPFDDLPRERQ